MNTFDSVKGKVAIVTGGASGMGREIVKTFAAHGMKVIIADIQDDKGQAVADAIVAEGGQAIYHHTDCTDEANIQSVVEAAVREYGQLHVMVNNAGITPTLRPVHEYTIEEFERVNNINYTAVFLGVKHAVKAMIATDSRECAIINIASASGLKATQNFMPYDASKHAVVGLTKAAGLDYAKHDITVNAICPGVIDTEIFANAPEEVREINRKCIPIGRFGRPEEISYLALFLASDMARFMTGSAITIDGGFTGGDQNDVAWSEPDPRSL